jgi:peptidoglycan/LPS O-acetylase OafA/YrhL
LTCPFSGYCPAIGSGRLGYRPAFDGLRAVAVVLVVLFHANVSWARGGYLGVDVFFVLSGFLITRLLLEERQATGRTALGRFYLRRVLRLFPALVVVSIAVAIYANGWLNAEQASQTWHDVAVTATYRMNWAQALSQVPPFGLLDHTWSLSIEEQFYVLWPLVVIVAHRIGGRWAVLGGAVAGTVASAVLRGLWWHDGTVAHRVYYGLDTHADGLLLGCALATLTLLWPRMPGAVTARLARWLGPIALVAMVIMGARIGLASAGLYSWIYPLFVAVAAVVIVDIYAGGLTTAPLRAVPLVALGRISYGLYLWHWPVFLVLNGGRLHWGFVPLTLVRLAASLAMAVASFFLVEQPFLRLKRRLEPAGRLSEPTFDPQAATSG